MNDFDLRGLDTFNEKQAAHYMNRSHSKFKKTAKSLGIPYYVVDGIKTFRKTDVFLAMERERLNQWQHTESAVKQDISAGTKTIQQQGCRKKGVSLSVV